MVCRLTRYAKIEAQKFCIIKRIKLCDVLFGAGANLWITGRNEEKLQETAENCRALGAGNVQILKVNFNIYSLKFSC